MKLSLPTAAALAWVTASATARAGDSPTFADRSRDYYEENDRTFALMLNPLDAAVGMYGAEADVTLGRHAALSIEGDFFDLTGEPGTAFGAGLLLYPLRTAFHGLYVEPQALYVRPLSESPLHFDWRTDVLGVGSTVGWQWTWDYGFSVRLGGGALYFFTGADSSSKAVAVSGPQLVLDGSLGWAF
jgi:hypothetical protein